MPVKPIFYSPSAQEHNLGAGDYGTEETEMNLIADIGIPDLVKHGFTVFRNHRTDDLNTIIKWSNRNIGSKGLHIAVHSNATGVPGAKRRGCTVYCYKGSTEGRKLAQCIYDELSALTPVADRGAIESDYYGELRLTHSVAVIIEVDFHDNIDGAKWIETHRTEIAKAINKGICKYCGIKY
jgi:N-acetylmuramoyl-L-alanine amidase